MGNCVVAVSSSACKIMSSGMVVQGLLKLLWTVYSEGKLQSCLKLRNFQNPFNKDKSVGLYVDIESFWMADWEGRL